MNVLIWLGWVDSNHRMSESKSDALPLGDIPFNLGADKENRTLISDLEGQRSTIELYPLF